MLRALASDMGHPRTCVAESIDVLAQSLEFRQLQILTCLRIRDWCSVSATAGRLGFFHLCVCVCVCSFREYYVYRLA